MSHLGAVTLLVRDYDEAIAWFTDKLGFDLVEDTKLAPDKRWVLVAPPGCATRLLLAHRAMPIRPARSASRVAGAYFCSCTPMISRATIRCLPRAA